MLRYVIVEESLDIQKDPMLRELKQSNSTIAPTLPCSDCRYI